MKNGQHIQKFVKMAICSRASQLLIIEYECGNLQLELQTKVYVINYLQRLRNRQQCPPGNTLFLC